MYWAEGPEAEAGVVFGVGQADESLAWAGVTRLTLHHIAAGVPGATSSVGLTHAEMRVRGGPDDIGDRLDALIAALTSGPTDSLAELRLVLAANQRRPSAAATALQTRYGTRGAGLYGRDEYGLCWLGPEEVRSWRDRMLTAPNAAAWVVAPRLLPLRLELGVRARPLRPFPRPVLAPEPAWRRVLDGDAHLSVTARPSAAWEAAVAILARRVGVPSGPVSQQDDLPAGEAHAVVGAPGLEILVGASTELAGREPSATELAEHLAGAEDRLRATAISAADLVGWCRREVARQPGVPRATSLAAHTALSGADVVRAWSDSLATALFLVPPTADPARTGARAAVRWSAVPAGGTRHEPVEPDAAHPGKHLVVDDARLTLVLDEERAISVAFRDATALRWPGGRRGLWGEDGTFLNIEPEEWHDGISVAETVDRRVAAPRTVPLIGGSR